MVNKAADIWREFNIAGNPLSLQRKPPKSEVREWGTWLESRAALFQVSVFDYGAIGDGVSRALSTKYATLGDAQAVYPFVTSLTQEIDFCAIQRAIDIAAPWVWQGSTRATELSGVTGTVYIPAGKYRLGKSKLRFNSGVRLVGDGPGMDFPLRTGAGGTGGTGGAKFGGTTLYSEHDTAGSYAFDTSPYNASGVRTDNYLTTGSDSFAGTHTQVSGVIIENMTLLGSWSSFGVNMSGADNSHLRNVTIKGFHVGLRWSAGWYSSMYDVRIIATYRGIITWMSQTELAMFNVSVNGYCDGVTYNPATARDGSDPTPTANLLQGNIDQPCGILSNYGNTTGFKVSVENFYQAFLSYNSVDNYNGVYVEGTTGVILRITGPDQQNSTFDFDTLVSNTAPLIWSDQARLTVIARNHNYTQGGFTDLLSFVNTANNRAYVPVLKGLSLNASDISHGVTSKNVRNIPDDYSTGTWSPILNFGGASAGTQSSNNGQWWRLGSMIFASFYINVPTISGSGNAKIANLPFTSSNGTINPGGGPVLFAFAAPAGMNGWVQQNVSEISLVNNTGAQLTNTGFSNGVDIRGFVFYQIKDLN